MRTLQEPVYRERIDFYRHLGRREGQRIMLRRIVALVVLAGLFFGALALIHSRPAHAATKPTPVAAGGGRTMVTPSPLAKWVRRYVEKRTKGVYKGANVVVECRGVKCAAYNKPGTPELRLVVVKLADGRFHMIEFLVGAERGVGQ